MQLCFIWYSSDQLTLFFWNKIKAYIPNINDDIIIQLVSVHIMKWFNCWVYRWNISINSLQTLLSSSENNYFSSFNVSSVCCMTTYVYYKLYNSMTSVVLEYQYWVFISNQDSFSLKVIRFRGRFDLFWNREMQRWHKWINSGFPDHCTVSKIDLIILRTIIL